MGIFGSPIDPVGGLDVLKNQLIGPFKKKLSPEDVRNAHITNDFSGGFVISEIEEGRERKKEEIRLLGSYMIHAPFEFGGEQKLIKNYYPGQSEPSVQVLGPQETDITIKGRLYDKRFKDKKFRGIATEFQKQMDAIRIRGNLLRLHMGDAEGFGFQRYGFLQKTSFKLKNIADIEYELQFAIVGFNAPKGILKINRSNEIPFRIQKELIEAATKALSELTNIPGTMPKSFADQIRQLTGDVASAVKLVTGFVDTVFATVDDLKSAIARAQGLIKFAKNKATDYKRRVGTFSFTGASFNPAARGIAGGYLNAEYVATSLASMTALQQLLATLSLHLDGMTKSIPIARYRVVNGDTLQKIAVRFYNDQNNWKQIFDHNKLTTTVLTIGQVLEIPRL